MAKVQGWASTQDLDLHGEVVAAGAYADAIRIRGITGPRGIKLLIAHDINRIVGSIDKLEQRNGGLWIEADIEEGISYGKDLALAVKAAGGVSFSIGYVPIDVDIDETPDGREHLLLKKIDLFEVSVVTRPANPHAIMTEYN